MHHFTLPPTHISAHGLCNVSHFRITKPKLLSCMGIENSSSVAPVWEIQPAINKWYA